ncbi:hypothetical protein ElyMa_005081300 [Elysia marginata]|uniref:Uncharacterized protein n=1 Tax=Elysia marginata TaxID=1093978 RepID=A0AAV4JLE8_9GAST|nr:hypothetical protein ElyMa_005081300 [Elysia marginata]
MKTVLLLCLAVAVFTEAAFADETLNQSSLSRLALEAVEDLSILVGPLQLERLFLRKDLFLSGPSPASSRSPLVVLYFFVAEGSTVGLALPGILVAFCLNHLHLLPLTMVLNGSSPVLPLRSSFEIMFGRSILSIRLRYLFCKTSSLCSRDFLSSSSTRLRIRGH